MLAIMDEYGSEVSENRAPAKRKTDTATLKKSSVIRQFRRWNPNFLDHFAYRHGQWVAKLGRVGELKRRAEARRQACRERSSSSSNKMTASDDTGQQE
jgi:hypothetical protein